MGFFDRFRGSGPAGQDRRPRGADSGRAADPDSTPDDLGGDPGADGEHPQREAVLAAIDAHWAAIGELDPDVVTYLVNPMFTGAPPWPNTRQAYRIVRTPSTVIIASDGLADPAPQDGAPGYGCEVYLETPDLVGAGFEQLRSSWAFAAIELFAQNVADLGGISEHLASHGIVSMELPLDEPEALVTEQDTVAALIGMPVAGRPAQVATALGPVDIVPLTLITPDELAVVVAQGGAGRQALAERRAADGRGHLSSVG